MEVAVRGRRLVVLGWGADPCCSDVPSPATVAGAASFVDGRRLAADRPFAAELGELQGLDEATSRALLQARLLEVGAVEQIFTRDEVAALVARWPAAASPVAQRPSGLFRDPDGGLRVWVWTETSTTERGIRCRFLDGWAARLTVRGEIAVVTGPNFADTARHARYSEGSAMGRPCGGQALR